MDTPTNKNPQRAVLGFAAGTQVHTRDGLKPIEQVQVGDWVLSHPAEQPPPTRRRRPAEYSYRAVTQVLAADCSSLAQFRYRNDADGLEDTLHAAPAQAVWSKVDGWISADSMQFGRAVVLSFNGNALVMEAQRLERAARVFALCVEEFGTYYVGQLGAWVRSDSAGRRLGTSPVTKLKLSELSGIREPQTLLQIDNYYNDTLAVAKRPRPIEPARAEQFRQAAERTRSIVLEQLKVQLNYDVESLRWLNGYIDRIRSGLDQDKKQRLIGLLGAFVGECVIRNVGGEWASFDDMVCVLLQNQDAVFPANKVAKQFENGSQSGDSVLGFFETTLALQALSQPLKAAQKRLLAFYADDDHRIYVPQQSGQSLRWMEIAKIDGAWITLRADGAARQTMSLALPQVTSYYVCGADGKLLHTEWISSAKFDTLPVDILAQLRARLPSDPTLTLSQLETGKRFIAIEFSKGANTRPGQHGEQSYATTLRNVSAKRVKITKFGGYRFIDGFWILVTVTRDFYTADHFREWYRQDAEWLEPGEAVTDAENWGEPPTLWAYCGVSESGESFIGGRVLERQPGEGENAGTATRAYYVTPTPELPQMQRAIDTLRGGYSQVQKRLNASRLAALGAAKPFWMKDDDALNEVLRRQPLLLAAGEIVWGALIQANKLLFAPGRDDCPALLVHSVDRYFDAHPDELRAVGREMFALKGTNPDDPVLKAAAELVSNEMDRSMAFKLPAVFSARDISAAAFMVFRKHIPEGVLSVGLFPILVHPSTQAVMIVPYEFWPADLLVMWNERRL